jgi:hypothetical protein
MHQSIKHVGNMHQNADNMQEYAWTCMKYAIDMHKICKQYARNMHNILMICKNMREYANNMLHIWCICKCICTNMLITWGYMHWICHEYAINMQTLKYVWHLHWKYNYMWGICRNMQIICHLKICTIYTKMHKNAQICKNMQDLRKVAGC